MRVSTNLIALPVAQHGDVRQQQRAVLADPFELEPVFVYEVEGQAATEQGLIRAVGGLAHVVARMSDGRAWIQKLRALADDDANIGAGPPRLETSTMLRGPLKVITPQFLP